MAKKNVNQVLWENISNCMLHFWKEINLYRLARDAKIGTGGAARLKEQESSTRLSTLVKVAALFKGIEAWHLLLPDLDPANPLRQMSESEKKLYSKFKEMMASLEGK